MLGLMAAPSYPLPRGRGGAGASAMISWALRRVKPAPAIGRPIQRALVRLSRSAGAIDILEMFPAATHHCAIKCGLSFLVEAFPAFASQPLRERIVWRLKLTVHVKIFVSRCVGVLRIKAAADEQANSQANQICRGKVSLHDV